MSAANPQAGRLTEKQADFLARDGLQDIFDCIETAGGEARVIGGAVRNALIGMEVEDVDLCTTLDPDAVTKALEACGIKVKPTGYEHGTVTAVTGHRGYEITTLREDVETDGRRAVVRYGTDWIADALRRDFTMNALSCDREGRLFDPVGGLDDLLARRVRFIGDPLARIREDHLRILRFFRFYAWYGDGRPDADGLKACAKMKDSIQGLSVERIWMETKKLLRAPDPVRAVLWMRTSGVMAKALPETGEWGTELLQPVVERARSRGETPDAMLRLMALLPNRGERVEALCERLKLSLEERKRLREWADMRAPSSNIQRNDFHRLLYAGSPRAMLDVLAIEEARLFAWEEGKGGDGIARLMQWARDWRRPQLPVGGKDLRAAGIEPGPRMGKALARLEKWWVEQDFAPDRAQLLERLPSALEEIGE
jgi:poly(A) polymerase